MGAKCFKDSDTPWITFKCNFVNVKNSDHLDMDFTDSGNALEEAKKNKCHNCCCCLSWMCRRRKKEKEMTVPQS